MRINLRSQQIVISLIRELKKLSYRQKRSAQEDYLEQIFVPIYFAYTTRDRGFGNGALRVLYNLSFHTREVLLEKYVQGH